MSDVKDTILKKGIKAIPNIVWVVCASYALIMFTNLFFIKFTEIDLDKHINRYFEIKLNEIESKRCVNPIDNKVIELISNNRMLIDSNHDSIKLLFEDSHKPSGVKR
jgi:hypothetical protein